MPKVWRKKQIPHVLAVSQQPDLKSNINITNLLKEIEQPNISINYNVNYMLIQCK